NSSGARSGRCSRNATHPITRRSTVSSPAATIAPTAIQDTGTYGTVSAVDGRAGRTESAGAGAGGVEGSAMAAATPGDVGTEGGRGRSTGQWFYGPAGDEVQCGAGRG